jgi:hypothetical protein
MGWSDWKSFLEIKQHNIPERPGVYLIRYSQTKGLPAKINRAYGVDQQGTLSVGETSNLKDRLTGFYRTFEGNTRYSNHAASWYYVSCRYDRFFKKNGLQFRYKVTSTKKAAQREEFILLAKYRNKFLDLPPLNNSPGKYPDEDWEEIMKGIFGREPLED